MLENIRLAFQGIWGHKLRSLLTMLGIIIGIASIITIVSTIKGTNEQIKENLIGSGNNLVNIKLYSNDWEYAPGDYTAPPTGVRVISEQTRQTLEQLDGVERVALYTTRSYADSVYYQDNSFSGTLFGVDQNYFGVQGYQVVYGRDFTQRDFDRHQNVIILDTAAASALMVGKNPIGEIIEIKKQPFTIIGVVELSSNFRPVIETLSDYETYADTSSGKIFLPSESWGNVYQFDEQQNVCVKAKSTDDMTTAGKSVADYLTENLITQSARENGFCYRSEDLLERVQKMQKLSSSTNSQLIWIASISLLVGGIGVMNIMLVSVTERTGEIGLKKAIGAKRRRILWQFLTEASVLTSVGGLIGVGAGIVLAKLLSKFMSTPTAISVPAIGIAVLFSMVIGIVFGLLPAVKASKLSPIVALRRD